MIEKCEKILNGLIKGNYKPDKIFEFDNVDPYDESQGSSQEVLFNINGTDNWILSNINWSCHINKGMKGDYLTPDDPDNFMLDNIEIENFSFGEGEDEHKINVKHFPNIEKLFIKYLKSLWNEQMNESNDYNGIKNYKDFLLEWGYGGEGGVPSKDPVKVKSSMITEIDLGEEEEQEDKDIPVLKDIDESIEYEDEIDED